MRGLLLLLVGAAFVAPPAAAQLIPGTVPPENVAQAVDEARMVLCTLAAGGRPMGGLNMDLVGGEGYTPLAKVPEPLARFVQSAPPQRMVEYRAPGGPLWIVHDPSTGRCGIYTFAEAAPIEAKLLASLGLSSMWKRKKDGGPGIDHLFEWKVDRSLRLRTEISRPHAPGEPFVVVVRPAGR
jgi:hypothetical protein